MPEIIRFDPPLPVKWRGQGDHFDADIRGLMHAAGFTPVGTLDWAVVAEGPRQIIKRLQYVELMFDA